MQYVIALKCSVLDSAVLELQVLSFQAHPLLEIFRVYDLVCAIRAEVGNPSVAPAIPPLEAVLFVIIIMWL